MKILFIQTVFSIFHEIFDLLTTAVCRAGVGYIQPMGQVRPISKLNIQRTKKAYENDSLLQEIFDLCKIFCISSIEVHSKKNLHLNKHLYLDAAFLANEVHHDL